MNKKRFLLNLGAMLVGVTSLFAQPSFNYTITFSANVTMDSIQVRNKVSGVVKTLYTPDNVITLQKNRRQGTAVETVDNSVFLQQTSPNTVVVNMEKTSNLNLTLYSSNGSAVARYSNKVNAGQMAFEIGAAAGGYVLVAATDTRSASLKLVLTKNMQHGIFEVQTQESEIVLKSINDVITFSDGDKFEFIGYYKTQTDVKTLTITGNTEIVFSFTKDSAPSVATIKVFDISTTTATVKGMVMSENTSPVTERGICWSTNNNNPTVEENKYESGSGLGSFSVELASLNMGTTYFVRAYAINDIGIAYGKTIEFIAASVPTVVTIEVSDITDDGAVIGGNVTADNGLEVNERGICWATTTNPTVNDNKKSSGNGTGNYSVSLTELSGNTKYYARAYAINQGGTAYGEVVTFTTKENVTAPTVATTNATEISENSATIEGNVTADNGATVSERGVCWATTTNPTVNDNKQASGRGTGSFSVSLTSLMGSTTYYARAYAINSVGIAYGETISFTTKTNEVPIVTTSNVLVRSTTMAILGGEVESDNGFSVSERGVCWATTTNPTIDDNKSYSGSGVGSFSRYLDLFSEGVTYYVRAYAINSKGIAYGETVMFTMLTTLPPTVNTELVLVNTSYALLRGNATSDYGVEITERGACWATTDNPTVADNKKVVSEWKNDEFTILVESLDENTTYYARAYAVNKAGIGYGETVSFTTKTTPLPTIVTVEATNITENTATIGGNVISNNGYSVIERGICWATTDNPTMADNKKEKGSGTGSFSVTINSLASGTTYYARAYAINQGGTVYGETITFTTQGTPGGVTIVNGAIKAEFSVSSSQKVYFSIGNLQCQDRTNTYTWCFAEHQYDIIGLQPFSSAKGDLFPWGTSGWSYSGAEEYKPTSTSERNSDFYVGGSAANSLTGNYSKADWGVYNKISNGGNQAGLWRTLTAEEWDYLFHGRPNAEDLYANCILKGTYGIIILPDDAIELSTTYHYIITRLDGKRAGANYNDFSIHPNTWEYLEAQGAVFLPTSSDAFAYDGYWSSSAATPSNSGDFGAKYLTSYIIGTRDRSKPLPVRLVQDVK